MRSEEDSVLRADTFSGGAKTSPLCPVLHVLLADAGGDLRDSGIISTYIIRSVHKTISEEG